MAANTEICTGFLPEKYFCSCTKPNPLNITNLDLYIDSKSANDTIKALDLLITGRSIQNNSLFVEMPNTFEKMSSESCQKITEKKSIVSKLAIAAALVFSLFFTPAASSADTVPVPTLDKLHQNNVINPGTMDKDPDGNPIQGTGEIYPESAYILTPTDKEGTNTIKRYEIIETTKYYDPNTGLEVAEDERIEGVQYREVTVKQAVEKYYTVSLKQTDYYGSQGVSDEQKQFKITVQNPKDSSTPAFDYDITYHVDSSRLAPERITEDLKGADINNDFINKHTDESGGAIDNSGNIGNITGDFIGNHARDYGGAIYNRVGIDNITGDFIGNYADDGGAIANNGNGNIVNITGDFIGNHAGADGGAVHNFRDIGNITGDFIGNYTGDDGGAIYNSGNIGNITGDFIGNYGSFASSVHNKGKIDYITGNFNSNFASTITNRGDISNITGNFIGNYDISMGGAVYNYGDIGSITGVFVGNYTGSFGGAIYNSEVIENITGVFVGNYTGSYGGAINNSDGGNIGNITGDFIGNYSSRWNGGAIYNSYGSNIGNITGDFINNYIVSTEYSAQGGAICNYYSGLSLTDSSFINNYVVGKNEAKGGAIYLNSGTVNITADKKDVIFEGNFSASSQNPDGTFNDKKSDGIYIKNGTLNLNAKNNDIILNDTVTAESGTISINGSSNIYFNNNDNNLNLTEFNIEGGNLKFNGQLTSQKTDIGSNGSVNLDLKNNTVSKISLGALTLNNNLNLKIDADLSSGNTDSINVNSLVNNGNSINIEDINITSDLDDKDYIYSEIINANVELNISDAVDAYLTTNYKYNIIGLSDTNVAYLLFKKEGVNLGLPYTIKESGNIVYSMTEDEVINDWILNSEISSDSFTLNGNGHTIKSADSSTEGLVLTAQKELYIDNVKEISGFVSENGGAILSSGTLNISNTTFTNNSAKNMGGAITASGTTNISNSTFSGNTVANAGGAIYIPTSGNITEINGMISGSSVSYKDESITAFDPGNSYAVSDGYNIVVIQKMELSDDIPNGDVMFEEYKNQLNQGIADGSIAGSVSDLPVMPSRPEVDEEIASMIEDLSSKFQQATIEYDGEVLGTYIVNPFYGQGQDVKVEFGIVSLNGQTAENPIEYTIKDTVFKDNKVHSTTSNALGGAIAIENKGLDLSSILKPTDLGTIDAAADPSGMTKEEVIAMLEEYVKEGIFIKSMDEFISDEYTGDIKDPKITFINTSFINNSAQSDSGEAKGGAIYANTDLTVKADNGTSLFKGNTANGESNAIYLDNADKTLYLDSRNKGLIQFDDKIYGQAGYKVSISGDDEKSTVAFNNNVDNAVVTSENVTISLGNNEVFKNSDFTINSGGISLVNDSIEQHYAKSFNINGNINLSLDADLSNASMDRLPENTIVSQDGKINVANINLTSDSKTETTNIQFAHDSYKEYVQYTGASQLSKDTQVTQLFAPIYKYGVSYDPESGMFTFVQGAGAPSGSYEAFNPSVVAPAVVTQAGAYTTQLQTFNYAFQHSDNFMAIPYLERISIKNSNKYALSPTADATDVGTFSPLLIKEEDAGFWVKPYASFESIPLKNGPKVSNINYGTLVGYDSKLTDIGHGWDRVLTGYIGYNGASQRYQGVDTYQNGGLIGSTITLYKGNFFNATTVSVGASVGDSSNMYGNENYTMLLAGIGNKTGYNFEFKEGKYIIQPAMLLSYTFVNTFDYTNAAGLRIESDPLHAIQVAPGVKFIMNTKNGWQPYIGVNMVWNLMDKSDVRANDVRLPEMSIKPYVQYGVGVQKRFKDDNVMAYGQAMIHNGGRNGLSLSFGLRWKVGKD